jgi:Uma2 family endonuclease
MTVAEHVELEPQTVVLDGISWRTFISMMRDLEDEGHYRHVTYDRGRLVLVSPITPKHEKWKTLLRSFVEAIGDERNIDVSSFGQTLWKRKDLKRGLEPDECFYIQHELQMRGKLKIDLRSDPPPDLCIEIDLRRTPIDKRAVYAALGIPELWHYDGHALEPFALQPDGHYQVIEKSRAFPLLPPAELKRFLDLYERGTHSPRELVRAVREWVRTLPHS